MRAFAWPTGSRRRRGMRVEETPEFTALLEASRCGNEIAWSSLMRLVYADLRRIAQRHRFHAGPGESLNTTGLLHESYFRLAGGVRRSVTSRMHFYALASRIMRQVMVDYARERIAQKRGGGQPAKQLHELDALEESEAESMVQIDAALASLEKVNPIWARIVECRFFAGLNESESAQALGISTRTAQRHWSAARGWLSENLELSSQLQPAERKAPAREAPVPVEA